MQLASVAAHLALLVEEEAAGLVGAARPLAHSPPPSAPAVAAGVGGDDELVSGMSDSPD
jgi:hypothetical protein